MQDTNNKKEVAIFTGGNSGEHSISLQSAALIAEQIDRRLYRPWLVVVKGNEWWCDYEGGQVKVDRNSMSIPVEGGHLTFDVVFMMIHGTPGEDGMIPGFLDMMGIPYTTSGRLTSALTFSKYFCSRYVAQLNCVNIANSVLLRKSIPSDPDEVLSVTGLPCFVKPNQGGSSVGMSKVSLPSELLPAIEKAFMEDDEVLVESFVKGTEVTCGAFMKDGRLIVLPLTEIVSKNDYFDYEAKYLGKSDEITPARIPEKEEVLVKNTTANLYRQLDCKGVVRFDYILSDKDLFFLEANTVPGMSKESIIPKMLECHGLSLTTFITAIIGEALKGH